MKSLFLDASSKNLTIAVILDDGKIFKSNVLSYSKHSNYLMNEIINILEKTNIKISEIDNFIVLNGPGSFTGIRVGITIAKTLAWVLNKKIFVLNNLYAIKLGLKNDIIISVIYDKDNYSYVGIYCDDNLFEGYASLEDKIFDLENKNITIATLEDNNYSKNLLEKLSSNNNVEYKVIEGYNINEVVNTAIKKGNVNVHFVKPTYMKKIDVEK